MLVKNSRKLAKSTTRMSLLSRLGLGLPSVQSLEPYLDWLLELLWVVLVVLPVELP